MALWQYLALRALKISAKPGPTFRDPERISLFPWGLHWGPLLREILTCTLTSFLGTDAVSVHASRE